MFAWMAVQFHAFTSSFFPTGKSRWLPFAFGSLALMAVLLFIGFSGENILIQGDKLYPQYGNTIIVVIIPLVILLLRNIYIFYPRLRNSENPVVYNQTISLLIGLITLTIFGFIALLPYGREYSLNHIANIANALILSYAVLGRQLVDIRFVFRNGLIWLIVAIIGLASYWALLLIFNNIFNVEITLTLLVNTSVAGIISVVIIYKMRDLVSRFLRKAFQGENYLYRENLLDFANKIHNIFSLKEQGGELLSLVIRAVGCSKAGLLFVDLNDDFEIQLIETVNNDNSLSKLKLRGDNPVIEYLKRERRTLTKDNITFQP
jgi:hypothetical protein